MKKIQVCFGNDDMELLRFIESNVTPTQRSISAIIKHILTIGMNTINGSKLPPAEHHDLPSVK